MKPYGLLCLGLLGLVTCSTQNRPTPTATASPTPTGSPSPAPRRTEDLNVVYCTPDGQPQMMDIYYPQHGGPWPVFLYIHGGGWTDGDKEEGAGWRSLNEYGFLVVSVNYRMYPAYTFPAMIEDVKCAVRYLRAHADGYNLNPNKIVAAGASAGGHLAALLGTSDKSAGWDVGEYLDQSSRVQGVFSMSGPTDLTRPFPLLEDAINNAFAGAVGEPQSQRQSGSPITYASDDDPPFLLMHGDKDPYVPSEQGELFHARLQELGVDATLVIVENGDHGLNAEDGSAKPAWSELWQMLVKFLRQI